MHELCALYESFRLSAKSEPTRTRPKTVSLRTRCPIKGVSCLNCFVSTSHSIVRRTNISCNIKNIIYAMVSVPSAKHAQKCCTEASYLCQRGALPAGAPAIFFLTVRKRCSIWVIHQSKEYINYDV